MYKIQYEHEIKLLICIIFIHNNIIYQLYNIYQYHKLNYLAK